MGGLDEDVDLVGDGVLVQHRIGGPERWFVVLPRRVASALI